MAQNYQLQVINIGSQSNDGTGDSIRDAFNKTNQNFQTIFSVANLGSGLAFTRLQDAPKGLFANRVITTDGSGLTLTQMTLVGAGGIQISYNQSAQTLTVNSTITSLVTDPAPTVQLGANINGQGVARAIQFADPKRDTDLVTKQWVEKNFLNRDGIYAYDTGVIGSQVTATIFEGSTLRSNIVLNNVNVNTTASGKVITTQNNSGTTATVALDYLGWKDQHLMPKSYIDTKISVQGISTIDPKSGQVNPGFGQMTGALQLFRDPIETDPGNTAATKHYVDNAGPLSTVNFYIATSGNDNRVDIPAYKRGRSLAWAYASLGKAAQAAVQFQKSSQIELGPYAKFITTDNFTNNVTINTIAPSVSGIPNAFTIYVGYDGSLGTDAFINASIFPGLFLEGVDSGAIGKIVNVVSQGGGTEYYEVVPVDYALAFPTSIVPLGNTGTVTINFASANLVALPSFWVGCTLALDNSYGGGYGTIKSIGVYYDATGNVYDQLTVQLTVPFASNVVNNSIPGSPGNGQSGYWHVYQGDFTKGLGTGGFFWTSGLTGEQLKYGQQYNTTEISFLIESGEYLEQLPIRLPDNTSIRGDEFRRSMIRPGVADGGGIRSSISTSPWVNVFFRRDTQTDGLLTAALNTSVNYSNTVTSVTPDSTTNSPSTGVVNFSLAGGYQADPKWIGKVFVGGGGQGIITAAQANVFSVNLAENSQGNRSLSTSTAIGAGSWNIYAPINFGFHYLRDPSRPYNLLGFEPGGAYYPQPGGYRNASAILLANREFIKAETIAYLDAKYTVPTGFQYDRATCKRDVGLMVDGLSWDLLNGGVYKTVNIADSYFDPASGYAYTNQLTQTTDAIGFVGTISSYIMANNTWTSLQSVQTITQTFSTVSLIGDAASTTTVQNMTSVIVQILNGAPAYNPGKHNDEMDMFLMNDATIIRYLAGQGHGGFMKVLDPEGQIKAKSPYTQTASSFSGSKGRHRFAGGFFVDGFTGNMQHNPTVSTALTNSAGDFVQIPVQGYALSLRPPQTPCFFYNNGIRYQVDYISQYNPQGLGPNTGTAVLNLDPNLPGGIYAVSASQTISGFQPNQLNMPVIISAPTTSGGVNATGYATTDANGNISGFFITNSGSGYRRSTDLTYNPNTDVVNYVIGGARFNFTIVNGNLQAVSISAQGSGYSTNTSVQVDPPTGSGQKQTAQIIITSVGDNGKITGVSLVVQGYGYVTTPNVTFGLNGITINTVIKKGFVGNLPAVIETITAGNRSMLANDFTQINDLGYGIFATNGGLIENVSMFTYYCWTSYYALNGAQLRTLTGSSCYGVYGLISEGSDPTEVPISITQPDELSQIVTVYNDYGQLTNTTNGTTIYVVISGAINYVPYNSSQIEINHYGNRQLYVVKAATFVFSPTTGLYANKNVYQLQLTTAAGVGGLVTPVPDGATAVVRIQTQFRVAGVNAATITRPSTVLQFGEDPTYVYRVLDYTDQGSNIALVDTDTGYDYITLQPYNNGGIQLNQGFANVTVTSSGTGYTLDGNFITVTAATPTNVTCVSFGVNGTASNPTFQVNVAGIGSQILHNGMTVTGQGVPSGTSLKWYSKDNSTVYLTSPVILNSGTTLTFSGRAASALVAPNVDGQSGSGIGFIQLLDGGLGYNTNVSAYVPKPSGGTSATILFSNLTGIAGSTYIKISDPGATAAARITSALASGAVYRFGYDGTVYNITQYIPPNTGNLVQTASIPLTFTTVASSTATSASQPYALIGVNAFSTGSALQSEMTIDGLFAGIQANTTGSITVRISTTRATSHDMLNVGTGGYSDSKYPNDLYGPPRNQPNAANQVKEIGKGRVYYVTSDQDGNFRVGKYFAVDQGHGTVTISAPISLSGINSLSFKQGAIVNNFSTDATMASESTQKVPVEQAVVYYVNYRLGLDKNGSISTTKIGPGFLPLTGSSLAGGQPSMSGSINMGSNQINFLAVPTTGSDAANKAYVDNKVALTGMTSSNNTGGQYAGFMTGPLSLAGDPLPSLVTFSAQGNNGNSTISLQASGNVYLGQQLNSPFITAGATITQISNNLALGGYTVQISGSVVGTINVGQTVTADPIFFGATKRYVDSNTQINQLRDVQLNSPADTDFLMFGTFTNAVINRPTPIYNAARYVVNVTNNATNPTNSSSGSGGGSDISYVRSGNQLTFKLVGGLGGNNPITDYHVNNSAAIQQSKLAMQAAGTFPVATTATITQANRGLAVFDPTMFNTPGGLGWVTLIDSGSSTTGIVPSKHSWVSNALGGFLGSTVAGAVSYVNSATMVQWLNVLPISGGTMSGQLNSQSIVPTAGLTYSLGGQNNRWLKIWIGDLDSSGTSNLNNVVVSGNLTVQGTTNTVNSQQSNYTAPVLDIAYPVGGGNLTTDDGKDKGILVHYFSGSSTHAFFGREDSTGYFTYRVNVGPNTEPANNPFNTQGSLGTGKFGQMLLQGGNAATGNNNGTGDLQVSGGAQIQGSAYMGTAYDSGNRVVTSVTAGTGVSVTNGGNGPSIQVSIGQAVGTGNTPTFSGMVSNGDVYPQNNLGSNIGSTNNRWATVYASIGDFSGNVTDNGNRVLTGVSGGTGVSISGSAPNQTISIGQAVGTGNTPTFAGMAVTGAVYPQSTNGADLGGSSNYWANIYVSNIRGGGTIYGAWSLGSGATLQSTYADLAEKYTSDAEYDAGTVVVFGGDSEVTISTEAMDRRVAGVVSTNPAFKMNSEIDGVWIALQGRVPCKVVGTIKKGDMMVTSDIDGVATSCDDPRMGTVIGKALADYDSQEIGIIEVAIGRL